MIDYLAKLGRYGLDFLHRIGLSGVFLWRILWLRPRIRIIPLIVEQIYYLGVLSLMIIVMSGLFIGMVLSLQGYNTLKGFGSEGQLGQIVALSIVRELGPVIAALLFASRAGSALTAEIGLMKSTEQLSYMEMMAVDPVWRVISPRFWAGVITMPILALIFNMVAIYGGYLIGVTWLNIDAGSFWSNMQAVVSFRFDILNGIIKSIVFGFVITWIALFQGYYTVPTSEGMSDATTKTVVFASLAVLGLDFLLTAAMMKDW